MAKNYTFAEAVAIINEGKDLETIADIGRRYPVLLHKVTKVATLAGADFVDLMGFMPDYLTANKVNTALKAAVSGAVSDDADADADAEDEDETPKAPEVASAPETEWNENMSAKQLWDILGKAGKRKLAKSTKKADLVEACKQAFGTPAAPAEEDEDEAEEAAGETNPYEGKSAMDLFKECKKRGIKAASRKPAKYYADLLLKADAEAADEAGAESDEEDWGDEAEAEEPKPAKAEKPAKSGKKTGKAAKAEKPAADDDDDWDI